MKLTEKAKKARQKMKERMELLGLGSRTKVKVDNFDEQDAQQIYDEMQQLKKMAIHHQPKLSVIISLELEIFT